MLYSEDDARSQLTDSFDSIQNGLPKTPRQIGHLRLTLIQETDPNEEEDSSFRGDEVTFEDQDSDDIQISNEIVASRGKFTLSMQRQYSE